MRWMNDRGQLKIGLLWSLTGEFSLTERTCRDVALFSIDKINRDGGIAGLKVAPVLVDAKSDIKAYREGALHLLRDEGVLAIFGGYTSASRRAIMPLIELNGGLLFYPAGYEGRECWQSIVCTGPIPNQQPSVLIPFMCERFGNRVYFVGTNNVRSQEAHRHARRGLFELGGQIVGETLVPVGQGDFSASMSQIRSLSPDWIFSTVIGRSDIRFRKAYAAAGFTPDRLPTASITTSELEVGEIGHALGEGHFVSAPYFQSIASQCNRQFVDEFLGSAYGRSGVTHFNMEGAYLCFLYFKKSIEQIVARSGLSGLGARAVRDVCGGISLSSDESPEGSVRIDPQNFNSWLVPKIGRFNGRGQVDILYQSAAAVPPQPFILYPSRGTCQSDGLHLPHGQVVKSAS